MQRIVTILDTALTVNYNDRPITTQKELDTYKFEFDDTWIDYVKTAVFYTDPAMVKHLLIPEDGIVTIPWEILTGKPQVLYIGVFGAMGDKVKPTTFGAVRLRDGSYIDGIAPLPPTPDVYQQIISAWEGAKADETERVANENSRRNNFDALVAEYNLMKADLQQQITDGTASVDALQVLETQYAAKALALETTYAPRLGSVESQLAERALQTALEVEKARINSFTTLAAGSTTGDAELIDARVGADGVTYPNTGGAVRGQITALNNIFTNIGFTETKKICGNLVAGGTSGSANYVYLIKYDIPSRKVKVRLYSSATIAATIYSYRYDPVENSATKIDIIPHDFTVGVNEFELTLSDVGLCIAISADKGVLNYTAGALIQYATFKPNNAKAAPIAFGTMNIAIEFITDTFVDVPDKLSYIEANIDGKFLAGKNIVLAGDSRSSTDYPFYASTLADKTGATVTAKGLSGSTVATQASNAYFNNFNGSEDFVIWLTGGNNSGASGTIGTFDASYVGLEGEAVVAETNIALAYSGTYFIQAVDHMMRKWKSLYYNWKTLNNGHKPVLIFCSDIPQKNHSTEFSVKANLLRKCAAIKQCCEKNGIYYLDLMNLCNFDMTYEPEYTGPTDIVTNNGLYYMDGLHPNKYGHDVITSIEKSVLMSYVKTL